MPVKLNSSGGGSVTLTQPVTAADYTQTLVAATDTLAPIILGTAQNTTSGTSIDFTGIPSWVKRITIMFNGVSLSGTANFLVQIGAGSIDATGYNSTGQTVTAGVGGSNISSTSGMIMFIGAAANIVSGHMVLTLLGSNIWISSHVAKVTTAASLFGAGDKTLSGTLDRVRLTTTNGTDTFDAGSVNIMYE